MSLPLNQVGEEEGKFASEINNYKGFQRCGDLLEYNILRCSKAAKHVVFTSYMIVSSVFGEENWAEGYRWECSQLKGTHESLSNRIRIEKAVKHFKSRQFDSDINPLKGFDKKEAELGILL